MFYFSLTQKTIETIFIKFILYKKLKKKDWQTGGVEECYFIKTKNYLFFNFFIVNLMKNQLIKNWAVSY